MDVFFETQSGDKFEIELGYWDTMLEIKEKIEKYQCIPVSKQTLIFQGVVLQDHLDIKQCVILNHSHIQIFVEPNPNPNPNNDQVLQTDISSPLNSSIDIDNFLDSPVSTSVKFGINNDDHVLQPEKSTPFNSYEEIDYIQDYPVSTSMELVSNNSDQVPQPEKSPPLNSSKEIDYFQEYPISTSMELVSNNNDQVPEPEKSPLLNSFKDIANTQGPSVKRIKLGGINNSHQDSTMRVNDLSTLI
ncbi:putative Ubiquitin domain-containing protein [Arabidopsis thaliana]